MNQIREPKQKRSIEKKEKIIEVGFELICKNGYYNTNTAKIAKEAGVSTGIVYQYFNDKHDIFIDGLNKYSNKIFFPFTFNSNKIIKKEDLESFFTNLINKYISNQKLSQSAHEEIMSLVHSDKEVAHFYYKSELDATYNLCNYFTSCNINSNNLDEKIHIIIGLIDNLCHENLYHKHNEMDYSIMKSLTIKCIINLIKTK